MIDRIPPHDLEVEKALLCCLMIDNDGLYKIDEINIEPEHFYYSKHSEIYKSIKRLDSKNSNIDIMTIKDDLLTNGKLKQVGLPYLSEVINEISTSVNIVNYAKILEDKYIKRVLINTCMDTISDSYENKGNKSIIDKVDRALFNITTKRSTSQLENNDIIATRCYNQLIKRVESSKKILGNRTGYKIFDSVTGGFEGNRLIILAGRPGSMKTTFSQEIAQGISKEEKKRVVYFSKEMSKEQFTNRQFASAGLIDNDKIKNGNLDDSDWSKLQLAIGSIADYRISIDDGARQTVGEMKRKIRRLIKDIGDEELGLIIVDYIGLMGMDKTIEKREAISQITKEFKAFSKEIDVPVMLLSQLNRECEKRPDKKPMISDLKDSGSIEEDADIIIFTYRPGMYDIKNCGDFQYPENYCGIIVAKNRDGAVGEVPFITKPECYKFYEMSSNDY